MSKKFLVLLLVLVGYALNAQVVLPSAKEMIFENPLRASCLYHVYEAMDTTDTPSPSGYKPFYISHIARHGSRYRQKVREFDSPIEKFKKYADEWGLTEDGQFMMDLLLAMRDSTVGHEGQLTKVGAKEHRDIANRMLRRFPEVFDNPTRSSVNVFSTNVKRTLESRDNFIAQLPDNLSVDNYVHHDSYKGIEADTRVKGRKMTKEEKAEYDSLKAIKYDKMPNPDGVSMERLVKKTFLNPKKYSDGKIRWMFHSLWSMTYYRQCMDEGLPYPYGYFTPEEIYTFWWDANPGWYHSQFINANTKGIRTKAYGCEILKHIIEDADSAVKGNGTAADFRFCHDVYVAPLISVIGCTGNDYRGPTAEVNAHWVNFDASSMAMNYQFIFYKNAKGKILVKMLLNEREVTIPSVKTAKGPYYDWKTLRKYLVSQTK